MKAFSSRIPALLLALLLVFSFAGCSGTQSEVSPAISPSAAPTPEAPNTPEPSVSPSDAPAPSQSPAPDDTLPARAPNDTLSFSVEGTTVTEAAELVSADFGTGIRGYGYNIYCLAEDYAYEQKDGADVYACRDLDNCWLELRFVPNQTVEQALPAFLDSYLSYTEIEYTGDYNLAGTLYTQGAVATDGDLTYAAYLADADGGILAFVLCYPNEAAEGQSPRLYAMLDSFEFNY